VYRLRRSQILDIRVFRALCVSCIRVFCNVQYSFKVSGNDTKPRFMSVFVGWHFSGGGSILLALHQIPLQPDQLSPKCLAGHPTSRTTAGNVQTAIPIRKMDACVSPEDDKCTHATPHIMSKQTLESRSTSNMLPVAGNRTHVTIQKVFYDDSS